MSVLRQIVSFTRYALPKVESISVRTVAADSRSVPLVDAVVDDEGIAVLSLQRRPVNALNLELIQELTTNHYELTNNKKCKGVILTSILPKVFSAGVDLAEFYQPDLKRIETFWTAVQDFVIQIYGSEITTVVAIPGHASAGACIMSIICDYRVMVDGEFRIGLNDTALGIVPATWILDIMVRTMGARRAELALTTSTLFTAGEALKAGLIDEIATDRNDALEKCRKFITMADRVPRQARALTKKMLRETTIKYIQDNEQNEKDLFMKSIINPHTQAELKKYIQHRKKAAK